MQTFTVKSTEEKHSKDGTKTFFVITDMTGAQFSLWEPIGMIKPGCVIEGDIQVKGKYANLLTWKIISQPAIAPPATVQPSDSRPPKTWTDNSASIEKQVAIKEIGEDWRAGKLEDKDILVTAYKAWIMGRLSPPPTPSTTSEKQQPVGAKPTGATSAPRKVEPVSVITKETVYAGIKKLFAEKNWDDAEKAAPFISQAFEGTAPLGDKVSEKLASLSQDNLLVVNARVNQALNPSLVEKAKQMGGKEVEQDSIPF